MPPLAFWSNQRVKRDASGNAVGIDQGFCNQLNVSTLRRTATSKGNGPGQPAGKPSLTAAAGGSAVRPCRQAPPPLTVIAGIANAPAVIANTACHGKPRRSLLPARGAAAVSNVVPHGSRLPTGRAGTANVAAAGANVVSRGPPPLPPTLHQKPGGSRKPQKHRQSGPAQQLGFSRGGVRAVAHGKVGGVGRSLGAQNGLNGNGVEVQGVEPKKPRMLSEHLSKFARDALESCVGRTRGARKAF